MQSFIHIVKLCMQDILSDPQESKIHHDRASGIYSARMKEDCGRKYLLLGQIHPDRALSTHRFARIS